MDLCSIAIDYRQDYSFSRVNNAAADPSPELVALEWPSMAAPSQILKLKMGNRNGWVLINLTTLSWWRKKKRVGDAEKLRVARYETEKTFFPQ